MPPQLPSSLHWQLHLLKIIWSSSLFPFLIQKFLPYLKGLCHQIRITWKRYCCKRLGMDMRRLIFKNLKSEPSIFNRHLKFLCLGSKRVQIFHFGLNLNWGYSKWVQIALFVSWNNSDFQRLFLIGCLISRIFYNHCYICVLKVAGVVLYRFWTQNEDNSLLNLCSGPNRAAPATFRKQIEQIQTYFEQPQIRFRTKWKIWMLFVPQLKKLKCLL